MQRVPPSAAPQAWWQAPPTPPPTLRWGLCRAQHRCGACARAERRPARPTCQASALLLAACRGACVHATLPACCARRLLARWRAWFRRGRASARRRQARAERVWEDITRMRQWRWCHLPAGTKTQHHQAAPICHATVFSRCGNAQCTACPAATMRQAAAPAPVAGWQWLHRPTIAFQRACHLQRFMTTPAAPPPLLSWPGSSSAMCPRARSERHGA